MALDTGRSGSISREDLRLLSLAKRKNDLEMAQQDGNDGNDGMFIGNL